ncbi:MAG: antibiotic biosynthesis monooxygenase [Bdellovibrionaceae bacterium]|nr:antibiotic biosynthesis monooxygenase [Pseudobdellovibrionaceae bacterium]|tara:strand:+ start:16781 stop:17059 length:279 start_codon:yes stop_codon:yes gene_type:complete
MGVTRITEFHAAEGKSEELGEFLQSVVSHIQSSEGNTSCELLKKRDDSSVILIIEKWENVEAHVKSIEAFPKDKMQSAVSLFESPPKGNYYI